MKKCKNCNKLNDNSAFFCSGCGSENFASAQTEEFNQDVRFDFTPTEIKGKVKAWQIIAITLACIAVITAGIFAVKSVLSAKTYTKGEVVENVYTNEWAEIKYVIADGFEDVTSAQREFYEDEYSDLGFAIERKSDESALSVSFQNLGDTSRYSERKGMDDFLAGYEEDIETLLGVTPSISEYFEYSVAGNEYVTARVDIPGVGVEYHCIRFEGSYGIVISVVSKDEQAVKEILSGFEYYEAE